MTEFILLTVTAMQSYASYYQRQHSVISQLGLYVVRCLSDGNGDRDEYNEWTVQVSKQLKSKVRHCAGNEDALHACLPVCVIGHKSSNSMHRTDVFIVLLDFYVSAILCVYCAAASWRNKVFIADCRGNVRHYGDHNIRELHDLTLK